MNLQEQMFEKDQLLATIYILSISLFEGAIEKCELALIAYGEKYDTEIYLEKGFLYIDGIPSWAYDYDKDERLGELLTERFHLNSLLKNARQGDRLYRHLLEDEAFEEYEKYD